jgi:hypothetical protein
MAVDPPPGCRCVRDVHLQLAADRRSVRLTGQLCKEVDLSKRKAPLPQLLVPVVLVQEKQTSVSRPPVPVTAMLGAPGTVQMPLPPLPSDWVKPTRQVKLELRDGAQVIWQSSARVPSSNVITFQKRHWLLTVDQSGNIVRLNLNPAGSGPAGN